MSIIRQVEAENKTATAIIADAVIEREKMIAEKQKKDKEREDKEIWRSIDSHTLKTAQTWERIAETARRDRNWFLQIVKDWKEEEKQRLYPILGKYIDQDLRNLKELEWVPSRLLVNGVLASSAIAHSFNTHSAFPAASPLVLLNEKALSPQQNMLPR